VDWYYFWYVNKKRIWLFCLLLLILGFVASLIVTDENIIGIKEQPKVVVTTLPATTRTLAHTTTTDLRITTTTDPRARHASRKFDTELFCNYQEDCAGNEHPLCNGFWTCEENACKWYCWT
jgi:hypothetical protein